MCVLQDLRKPLKSLLGRVTLLMLEMFVMVISAFRVLGLSEFEFHFQNKEIRRFCQAILSIEATFTE